MDSYHSTQQLTIFSHVGVLIYVFEVESRNMAKDLEYYTDCVRALKKYSPDASVFLLVHKMDLVRGDKKEVLDRKEKELKEASGDMDIRVFGTSIYDESLYKVGASAVRLMFHITEWLILGMVTNSAHTDTECFGAFQAPNHPCCRVRRY